MRESMESYRVWNEREYGVIRVWNERGLWNQTSFGL